MAEDAGMKRVRVGRATFKVHPNDLDAFMKQNSGAEVIREPQAKPAAKKRAAKPAEPKTDEKAE